jgi:hypothetical protein
LTMRLLNLLGVDIGPAEDLTLPTEVENSRGYWEPRWLMDLNDEILARLDTVWWRPLDAELGWEHRSDLEPLREQARRLLQEKFGSAGLWGWKEPRTTLTLTFWRELVPDARYVICLRNPVDAISSFQRRPEPNLSVGAWGELWLEYTARALEQTRESPRLLVFYEDLLRDGRDVSASRTARRRAGTRSPAVRSHPRAAAARRHRRAGRTGGARGHRLGMSAATAA